MINRAGAERKGSYAAIYSMTWSIAQIVSPLLATQTISQLGYNALWIILASFGLLVVIGIYFLQSHLQRGQLRQR
jgi:MFS family permease